LVPSKPTLPDSIVASFAIHHQMAIIHVQVAKNFIANVLLEGGYGVNIITKKLKV
jgi:hypothetical protein